MLIYRSGKVVLGAKPGRPTGKPNKQNANLQYGTNTVDPLDPLPVLLGVAELSLAPFGGPVLRPRTS